MADKVDMFELKRRRQQEREAPLAARMRPANFDEFVGQKHLVGPGRILRKAIDSDEVPSLVLWGPPGSGKTTLARLIASLTKSHFEPVSAVTSGVADLRRIVEEAKERRRLQGQRTILFVDEIHRFNRAQQDVILPHVEDGTITFIGATTENPSFEVVAPLLSRSRVFTLHALSDEDVKALVIRALLDPERGLGKLNAAIEPDALEALVRLSSGDARSALNTLEMAVSVTRPGQDGVRHVDLPTIEDATQRRAPLYDKSGDMHYDTVSAFIKSIRGSDPDAAVYWLGRMIESGEDPLFIARRLVILSAEDVGMAEPNALPIAVAAYQAVHFVGMPEGGIPLAQATVYLATCPKSNSAYMALNRAMEDVRQTRLEPVPIQLRNPVTGMMKDMGYGKEYRYSHEFPEHFVQQDFLPARLKGRHYWQPSDQGYEREAATRIRRWWDEKKAHPPAPPGPAKG